MLNWKELKKFRLKKPKQFNLKETKDMQQAQFLQTLAEEARLQAQISSTKVVPKSLERMANLIGNHTWKLLLVVSGIMSLLTEIWQR
ncbi:MAG: hypothetical protein A2383_00510 [Candidatus Pacebacteria bacterium RIFOXYB1_FULL_39_46]|nr:MAG: hypothetical protein A2182_00340 [Candidatus Pacebacteria bacterium RIFOXYA1_FULL_38_18]OGJ38070.1 MAG: hypothetical protein A2383_00510 [Candidatus Pacebacteria bacterium RIFOXYB1_FULL_39_46]OGJ39707.1 MAG: hypothetical protein A2411_02935 [Candidatus Pacebacteria bacterium RIFOXYC1_FULL_39_21]OGJ39822.1 MAG: hypothetical protein A2582_00275 [Candidatus Pacebacteria bacterium RIFOXYD1_FULL_39_27]